MVTSNGYLPDQVLSQQRIIIIARSVMYRFEFNEFTNCLGFCFTISKLHCFKI